MQRKIRAEVTYAIRKVPIFVTLHCRIELEARSLRSAGLPNQTRS
jgi:hypothetical protein